MKVPVCNNCKDKIGVEYKNEFYMIAFKVYCSLGCYLDKANSKKSPRSKK